MTDPYDSLDEDADKISGASIDVCSVRDSTSKFTPPDISDIIPLYGRETKRNEIKKPITKKSSLNVPLPPIIIPKQKPVEPHLKQMNKRNSDFTRKSKLLFENQRENKSYLNLFYKKIGYVKKDVSDESARGVCGDESFRSAVSSFGDQRFLDAQSFVSDTSSFYIQHIENDKKQKISDKIKQLSPTSFKSVSQFSLNATKNSINSSSTFKLTKFNKSCIEVPSLGSLGPDPAAIKEKMKNLKKQQSYGQRASNANRIKMMEKEVLKKFQTELKKSTEVSKITENCIIKK